MIPLGLTAAQTRALNATLLDHHTIRVRVSVRHLDNTPDVDITGLLIDGQVNVDQNQPVTRSVTLSLFDPKRALPFDSDSPAGSALYLDRMIRVVYDVMVPGMDPVGVPVFTGPISKLDRDGDTVHVEAQGKEALAMGACWRPITLRKGTLKTDAIRTIMRERAGETQFSMPDLHARLPRVMSLHREAVPWDYAHSIAHSMNRQLFYDGNGTLRLRSWPGTTGYTFTPASIVSPLQVSYSDETINTVWVKGGVPKGKKTAVTWTVVAPASHPLSPVRLGRNGVPRHLLAVIENDSIRSLAEAKAAGSQRLADGLRQSVDASFDAIPIPHLEPADLIRAVADEGSVTMRLTTYSLPLVVGEAAPMSVGYLRNVSVRARKRKVNRR